MKEEALAARRPPSDAVPPSRAPRAANSLILPKPAKRTLVFPARTGRVRQQQVFTEIRDEAFTPLVPVRSVRPEQLGTIPPPRPSDISTVETLAALAGTKSLRTIELSSSDLEEEAAVPARWADIAELAPRALARPPIEPVHTTPIPVVVARAASDRPPPLDAPPDPERTRRRWSGALAGTHVVVAVIAIVLTTHRTPRPTPDDRAHVFEPQLSPLGGPAAGAGARPAPPAFACLTTDSRLLAARAQIGPGLEVRALDTGFGLALATGQHEATALRLDPSRLRIVEKARTKTLGSVAHAVVDEDELEGFGVRVDADEARTVMGAAAPDSAALRVALRGNALVALGTGPHARAKSLWVLPRAKAPRTTTELVRANGGGPGGAAAMVVRRSGGLLLGLADAKLVPAGPLTSLARKGVTIGTPAVTAWGTLGAVAWSERAPGPTKENQDWTVYVAVYGPEGEVRAIRPIGKGISPTIAALPDGDLLVAHAEGAAGAHRVVATRLKPDLEPRGTPLVVSPETVNAGQPVAAVRPDGRALVAFFAAGPRGASVVGTSLACATGNE